MDTLHFALFAEQTATEKEFFFLFTSQQNRWQRLWQNPGAEQNTDLHTVNILSQKAG